MKAVELANLRAKFRKRFKFGAYEQAEYRRLIEAHVSTLRKYLKNFGTFFAVWVTDRESNYREAVRLFGRGRLSRLLSGEEISIEELRRLMLGLDLREEFDHYLVNKTHLSYSALKLAPVPVKDDEIKSIFMEGEYCKMAEFVFIILAEYIVLHNYMWASKLKPKGVQSIDKWLREIR